MNYYHDPSGRWRDSAEDAAEGTANRVFAALTFKLALATVVPTVVAVLAFLVVLWLAVNALSILTGWGLVLAVVSWCAMAFTLLILLSRRTGPLLKADRRPEPKPRNVNLDELTNVGAWAFRLVTLPLPLLATVELTASGWQWGWALAATVVGWLAPDASLVATFVARRSLLRLWDFRAPRSIDSPE
ncbi:MULTISPECIES: hypothetical protein [unclassified Crossiella]|uniref:hypothetical protein n=1 Tax=unclassified Crossiella TaxID=2620835 RepID=UPI001FFE4AD9|nr:MULTISPECIES: hypothetical protein [unclassified Crossiella]MCK2241883.1 hypothetical protein [Crossiella sp. S99.2]MCK2255786.1 hypothetical protein [Crossiella sp. S99.1]